MFWFKKALKVPEESTPAPLKYELSEEAKQEIRVKVAQLERMKQHKKAVAEYEAQVRAEMRLAAGHTCSCDSTYELGCDVHDY